MTVDTMERSVQDARRVEVYAFTLPSATYRLTSYDQDVTFDGDDYTATQISRSSTPLVPLGAIREVTITLALDAALAVDLRQYGIPPQDALVTIRRFFVGDADSVLLWQGYIGGISTDGVFARLRVPNKLDIAFNVGLPAKAVSPTCSHSLYDAGCGVDPVAGGFIVSTTIAASSGTAITLVSISGKPDRWAAHGMLVHTASDERRSVIDQVGTAVTIDYPFRSIANGAAVQLYAGCSRLMSGETGCVDKFANGLNFGGEPNLPRTNPAAPTSAGVTGR